MKKILVSVVGLALVAGLAACGSSHASSSSSDPTSNIAASGPATDTASAFAADPYGTYCEAEYQLWVENDYAGNGGNGIASQSQYVSSCVSNLQDGVFTMDPAYVERLKANEPIPPSWYYPSNIPR
jgi:hypothetical protein